MANDEFDDLSNDFGRRPSFFRRIIYFFLALESVATTTFLFIRIFLVDVSSSLLTLAIGIFVSTIILSIAYHNLSFAKAARIRRDASPPTKGTYKGKREQYEAAMKAFEGKISNSALWYSCAYNNAIFMITAPIIGVYILSEKVGGDLNLLLSGAAAAGLALFNSNSALKAIGES